MYKLVLSGILVFATLPALADGTNLSGAASDQAAVQQLIDRLGLRESSTAVRELPGWTPPKKIVVRPINSDWVSGLKNAAPGGRTGLCGKPRTGQN